MVKDFIEKNKEAMVEDLAKLVAYPSVFATDEKPFGRDNRLVLDEALAMMEGVGLKTTNLDYYCGYGEVGAGDEVIGILAHLDVVPAGTGWSFEPYKLTMKDGVVYGRGVSDDKGAVVASIYALKYLIESGYKFNRRVRLITGCNEESGSRCITHYVEKEGHIDMGFTPDADFPGIYAEKGMIAATLRAKPSKVLSLDGGTVSNVVCKEVKAKVVADFDVTKFKSYLDNKDIRYEIEDGDVLNIVVYGKAAHASLPDLGVNAIEELMAALYVAGLKDALVDYFHKFIGTDSHGKLFGAEDLYDEHSDLTFNLGVAKTDEEIEISVDCRFPVTRTSKEVLDVMAKLDTKDVRFDVIAPVEPLFFDKDMPMIKALKAAYAEVTGDFTSEIKAIGGGTYAKAIHNCIAFGCEFAGKDAHIHDADECLELIDLYKQVEIYIKAIQNLNEVGYEG